MVVLFIYDYRKFRLMEEAARKALRGANEGKRKESHGITWHHNEKALLLFFIFSTLWND